MKTQERFFRRIQKRALALFSTFVLALAFASLSQLGEYSAHRTATVPTPDGKTVQNREPEAVVPDSPAENSETVLIGPNPEIRESLLSLIRTAKSEFLLNVYLLTEPSVVESLVSAKKRGVDVRVILEKDPYRLPGANRKARDQLLSAGIEVFSSKDAFAFVHAKYAVADGNSYVFSTGNYTKTTFAKNREFFIFWNDSATAEFLRSVFSADFRGSPFIGEVPDRFYLAPSDARKKILGFVAAAEKSVTVFAPSVSDPEFVETLNSAASSGEKVRACLAATASAGDLSVFGSGVLVTRSKWPLLHAKTILADGKKLLIGSANFTQNSLDRNRETGAVFENERLVHNYENTLRQDCKW